MIDMNNPKALEQHLADIKKRLVSFSFLKPHGPELMAELNRIASDRSELPDESELIMVQDEFIHRHRLSCSKRRILDHFIETDKLLSEEDRRNLDGFRDYHIGMLEVVELREHSVFVHNLMNGWRGEVRASAGIEVFSDQTPVGSFVLSGLVYFGDSVWFSGCQTILPHRDRQHALMLAHSLVSKSPTLRVRGNRERIRAGFAVQAERHRMFVEFTGSDYFTCEPATFSRRMMAIDRYFIQNHKGEDGLTNKERCLANDEQVKWDNFKVPRMELPDCLRDSGKITICSTPADGVYIEAISPSIFAALETGNPKAVMKHGKQLRRMITSSEMSPSPLRIMANQFPDLFGAAVKQLFNFRTFDVTRDLEPLLFKYKGMDAEPPRYPTITLVEPDDPIYNAIS